MLPIFQYSAYIDFAISNIQILFSCTKIVNIFPMYFYIIRYSCITKQSDILLTVLLDIIFLEFKPITYNILFRDKSTFKERCQ